MQTPPESPPLPACWRPLNELLNRSGWELCRRCRRHKRVDSWCECSTAEEIAAAEKILLWRK
jgi:hypothetical protein